MGSVVLSGRSTWLATEKFSRRIGGNEFLVWDQLSKEWKRKVSRKMRTRTNKKLNQSKHIFIFSLLNNQANNIEPNTQQKKQQKIDIHHDRQTLIFCFFFHFFFHKTTKQKNQEEKYSSNYVRHSLSVSKQITESAIKNQFQFLWNSYSSHQIWRHNKSTSSHFWSKNKPRANRRRGEEFGCCSICFVWYCWIIIFVFAHSWGFFVSLFLFVVIEFVSVLLWTCIFVFVYFAVFSLFLLFFSFVGNCCYYFCSHSVGQHYIMLVVTSTMNRSQRHFCSRVSMWIVKMRSQQHQNDISHKTLTLTQRKQTQEHLKNQNPTKTKKKKKNQQ